MMITTITAATTARLLTVLFRIAICILVQVVSIPPMSNRRALRSVAQDVMTSWMFSTDLRCFESGRAYTNIDMVGYL